MSMHTPGPWEVQQPNHADGELWLEIGRLGRGPIAEIAGGAVKLKPSIYHPVAELKHLVTPELEQRANACLIAAAPELLEALQGCVNLLREVYGMINPESVGNETLDDWLKEARAALAKAEGRP